MSEHEAVKCMSEHEAVQCILSVHILILLSCLFFLSYLSGYTGSHKEIKHDNLFVRTKTYLFVSVKTFTSISYFRLLSPAE